MHCATRSAAACWSAAGGAAPRSTSRSGTPGPGIAEQHQQAIFDEFRRLDRGSPWGEQGLGLGLSICDRIARLLGLELGLRSAPGRGSVFRVRVPVGEPAPLVPAGSVPEPVAAAPSSLVGVTVLCVDNEPEILAGMDALMSRWGVRVVTATDSATARRLAASERPAVVLADYRLADGDDDGLALLLELCARAPRRRSARSSPRITPRHWASGHASSASGCCASP